MARDPARTHAAPAGSRAATVRGAVLVTRVLLVALLCCGTARAASLDGTPFPDSSPAEGQSLVLNGLGLRTFTILNVRGYVAGLYLAQHSRDPRQIMASGTPKVLLLQFLHSASKARVQESFHNGEVVNCGNGGCNPADQADFDRLVAAAPAVEVGDTFTFVVTARGVRFYENQRLLAESGNPDIGRLILLGFIGDHPPSSDLRRGLLGG